MSAGAETGGLVNMGLTCYANAVIQALRNNPRIAWFLKEGNYNTLFSRATAKKPRREKQEICTRAFAQVVQMLWQCKKGEVVRPGQFWRSVIPLVEDTMYEHLAMKAPHDAHEFFLFLLETMHESTAQEVEMRILRPPPQTASERLAIQALESWSREFSKEYSFFTDLFFGLSHWQTKCQACSTVSHRWESFNSLKLSIPKGGLGTGAPTPTFEEMLREEMTEETIEDYQCDSPVCGGKRSPAKRFMRLWRLPQTLVLVVKRFSHDGRKIHTRVAPLDGQMLNLAPFFSEESPERGGGSPATNTLYQVRAIVDHHGSSAGGHYTAQCKSPDSESWALYDDEGVMAIPAPQFGDSTYMVLLERAPAGAYAKEA